MILALTGSLGSGKSTVAEVLRELTGAFIIDADEITHRLQIPGNEAFQAIVDAFGKTVVQPDGKLDRKMLANIVFNDTRRREQLNAIIHPLVLQEQKQLLQEHQKDPLVILMIPLLYETGMERLADKVLVVTVNENVREERLRRRSGMTKEDIAIRLAAQMDQTEKVRRADFVVDNSGTLEKTRKQVHEVLKKLEIPVVGNESTD